MIFLLFIFISSSAFATMENPNLIPLGEKESLMGNTGVSGVSSGAAVFYQPADLVNLKKSFSLSGSTYLKFKLSSSAAVRIEDKDLPTQSSGFIGIPSSIISVHVEDGWAYAYGILVPSALELENKSFWKTDGPLSLDLDINFLTKHEDMYITGSIAKRVNSNFNIGVSLFVIKYSELNISSLIGTSRTNSTISTSTSTRQTLDAYLARLALGIQYKTDNATYGLRVLTPSIQLKASGDYFKNEVFTSGGVLTSSRVEHEEAEANWRVPLDISLGSTFKLTEQLSLSSDLGYSFNQKFKRYDGFQAESNSVNLKHTLRVKSGIEFESSKLTKLYAGLIYNPSRLAELDEQANNAEGVSRLDFYGLSVGSIFKNGKLNTGVGLYYLKAEGESYISGTTNEKSQLGLSIIGLTLSSSFEL